MTLASVWSSLWEARWLLVTFVFAVLLFLQKPPEGGQSQLRTVRAWLAERSEAVRAALVDLLDALRGVLPPVAVVVIVGAFTTPVPLLQVAIGATIGAILAHWIYAKEWRLTFDDNNKGWLGSYGLIGAGAGVVLLVLVLLGLTFLPDYDDSGGIPSALAITALLCFGAALAARLIGYAKRASRWRIVTVVLALALIVRTLLAFGVVRIKVPFDDDPTLALFVAVFVGGTAVCILGEAFTAGEAAEVDEEQGGRFSDPTAIGLGLAVASMAFISAALVWGGFEIKASAQQSTKGLKNATTVSGMRFADWSDDALALAFLPVLRFHENARWTPELVDSYVARAKLTGPGQRKRQAIPADLVNPCTEGQADPCRTLTLGCPQADKDDGNPCSLERTADPPPDKGIYVRVARKGRLVAGEPNPFEAFGPRKLVDQLTTLVQYWFFYDYDEWVAPVLGGRLVQRHEGDWEAVTVGLADDQPLFVGFSEHCGGVWQEWSSRLAITDTSGDQFAAAVAVEPGPRYKLARETGGPQTWDEARVLPTHPVVQVAIGSQANYPPRLSNRAPDWSTCQGIPREAVALLSYVSNIRDRTGSDFTYMPDKLLLVDRRTPPMTFPGTWGAKDSMQFVTTVDDPDAPGGRGPATPTRQPLWQRPVFQIFCSVGWRPDGRKKDWPCKT
jgi:hypothetical protein